MKTDLFGMSLNTWIETAEIGKSAGRKASAKTGKAYFFSGSLVGAAGLGIRKVLAKDLAPAHLKHLQTSELETFEFIGNRGPVWIVRLKPTTDAVPTSYLRPKDTHRVRDFFGNLARSATAFGLDQLEIHWIGPAEAELRESLLGLEMSAYRFAHAFFGKAHKLPKLAFFEHPIALKKKDVALKRLTKDLVRETANRALAVNVARHLVNVPPNELNPKTYSENLQKIFKGQKDFTIEVWAAERLKKERMNLLLAVGGASENTPCLVHLKYRPKGGLDKKPLAFVGKGITFDSGGLDIKTAGGMRLMKKDMGGSATLVGLAVWLAKSGSPLACDFYLAIAENSIGDKAFRPSDVIVSRSGLSVEVHNTDAEGRLVLADAMALASEAKGADAVRAIIDVATLTGAIKVGLGTEIAGLFCNDSALSEQLQQAGLANNDLCWQMPLIQSYRSHLKSSFADMSNCSDNGFGAAIAAALFLESFTGGKPWAHLDIYGWKDAVNGAYSEPGGSGQGVLLLTDYLQQEAF